MASQSLQWRHKVLNDVTDSTKTSQSPRWRHRFIQDVTKSSETWQSPQRRRKCLHDVTKSSMTSQNPQRRHKCLRDVTKILNDVTKSSETSLKSPTTSLKSSTTPQSPQWRHPHPYDVRRSPCDVSHALQRHACEVMETENAWPNSEGGPRTRFLSSVHEPLPSLRCMTGLW